MGSFYIQDQITLHWYAIVQNIDINLEELLINCMHRLHTSNT